MRIRAAVTDSKGARFAVQEVELGELRPEELLVRVSAAGICHTDLIIRAPRERSLIDPSGHDWLDRLLVWRGRPSCGSARPAVLDSASG
jgi:NADPH:quinone reductase-like Zn-dependent oxidoreductase